MYRTLMFEAIELVPLQAGLLGSLGLASVGVLILLVILAAIASSVEIVKPYQERALSVLGSFRKLLGPGIHFKPPFVSSTYTFDMRTQTIDVPRQEAITRDNSPVTADAVVYIKVMDAKKAFLEVEDYKKAVSNLAQTTLRAVLGDMELDDTLNKRQQINSRIREELDEPTDEWGIRVESVEVREVNPSKDVQQAMEKQTSAERTRRAMILEAQGERQSAIEEAQGEKQSNIIRAQGEKQAQILEAQGDALSTVLRARAADSMGERAVIERGMETLEEIGKGESTKFVLPQELTSLVGRYGKHLSGSDAADADFDGLESLEFDEETEELLGLDNIQEIAEGLSDLEDMDTEMGEVDLSDEEVPEADVGNPDVDNPDIDSENLPDES